MRSTGYGALAVVGVAAMAAVYMLSSFGGMENSTKMYTEMKTDMAYVRYISKYGKSYATKEEFNFRQERF